MTKTNILLILIILVSCKKYKEDNFISTYTPEKRLINTSSNIWTLENFKDSDGNDNSITDANFTLHFSEDSVTVSTLNFEQTNLNKWNFESSKKNLVLNDEMKFEILKLEVDRMKLKNEKGEVYSFKKILQDNTALLADNSILNIPLFGLKDNSTLLKLFDINHCEEKNMIVTINGNNSSNPIVNGLFGNAIGFDNANALNSIKFNFTKFYSKPGEFTFYYEKDDWTYYNIVVKINGVQTDYTEDLFVDSGENKGWGLVKVIVPNSGSKNISIESSFNGSKYPITAIDELKFWAYD
jgi:hypothetical protein